MTGSSLTGYAPSVAGDCWNFGAIRTETSHCGILQEKGWTMKTYLQHRPSVDVTILDTQRRPLRFTMKRLAMLRDLQVEFPELPVYCEVNGEHKHVPLEAIELWDMGILMIRNTSAA